MKISSSFQAVLRRFARAREGVAALEFAFVVPVMIIIALGLVEASSYVYGNQKAESAAANVLSLVNQQQQPTLDDLNKIAAIIPEVARPLTIDASAYKVIFTAIQQDKPGRAQDSFDKPYVLWQESVGVEGLGSSTLAFTQGGTKQQNALQPKALQGLTFVAGDQVIAVEVFMKYTPIVTSDYVTGYDTTLYYLNFSRPRKGAFAMNPRDKT